MSSHVLLLGALFGLAGCDLVLGLREIDRGDAGADAGDAGDTAIDALACPVGYAAIGGAPKTSLYRVIESRGAAWTQHDDCGDDLPGATHLLAASSDIELAAVHAYLGTALLVDERAWIGVVQSPTAATPGEGWMNVTDEAPALAWATEVAQEPNDGDGIEDRLEQFAYVQRGAHRYLIDNNAATELPAVCECDGQPVSSLATFAVNSIRP